jgi:hypothetical protein
MITHTVVQNSQNITSVLTLFTHEVAATSRYGINLLLSNLDTSADATIRVFLSVTRGGVEYHSVFLADTKQAAANETFHRTLDPILLVAGDTLRVKIQSTNTSDNNASSIITLFDLNKVDVVKLDGTGVVSTTGRIGALLPDVDGITNQSFFEALMAYMSGRSELTDNGDGTKTITYKKKDNTTVKLTITFNAQGEWTNTVIGS